MNDHFKPALAEPIGTFILVFIGAGSGATNAGIVCGVGARHRPHGDHLCLRIDLRRARQPGSDHRLGAHRQSEWDRAVVYLIAQLIGAALAGYSLRFILGTTGNLGATQLAANVSPSPVLPSNYPHLFLVTAVFASGSPTKMEIWRAWQLAWY